jgi:hypothetical protein
MFRGCKVNKKIFVLFLVPLLVVAIGGATLWRGLEAEAANSGTGTLNVVHGIPDAEVDICARGETTGGEFTKVITGFNFEDIETLELPEGNYDVAVVLVGEDCSNPLPGLAANDLTLPPGANVSIIAHLTENGEEFGLTVGVNNVPETDSESALITVYHVAAAPQVDIWAGKSDPNRELFTSVGNGEFGDRETRPGSYVLAVVPAGEPPSEAVAQGELMLDSASNTIVYAVGSLSGESFSLLSQVIAPAEAGTGQ